MKILYDPQCEVLARWFLNGVKGADEDAAQELAGVIQLAIEDWMDEFENGPKESADEGEDESGQGEEKP